MDIGNKFFDLVGGIHVKLTANGTLDAPPTLVVDQSDFPITNVSADGMEFDVLFPEHDVAAYMITATAPADNTSTPELEGVSVQITGSLSHSKATELTASVTDIPR